MFKFNHSRFRSRSKSSNLVSRIFKFTISKNKSKTNNKMSTIGTELFRKRRLKF